MARTTIYADPVLANNLRNLWLESGLTQKEFGEICGRERKTVGKWMNCTTSPNAQDLKFICLRFKVSADELMGLKKGV